MLQISSEVYSSILETIGTLPPETGGIIGIKNDLICAFFFDAEAKVGRGFYEPSCAVEPVIRMWMQEGIDFAGFVHSHLGYYTPTTSDIEYSKTVFSWYDSLVNKEIRQMVGVVESAAENGHRALHLFSLDGIVPLLLGVGQAGNECD